MRRTLSARLIALVGLSCTLVASADLLSDLAELDKTLTSIETVLDPAAKRKQIAELQEEASAPDLWNDQENAQLVTSRLSVMQSEVDRLSGLRQRVDDLAVLIELGQEESDEATLAEASRDLQPAGHGHSGPGGPHPAQRRVRQP